MKPRLLIIFLLIVLLPLALITFLGLRLAHYEQQNVNRQLTVLLTDQLNNVSTEIARLLEQRRRQLSDTLTTADPNTDNLQTITDENPYVAQVFLLNPEGRLIYPSPQNATEEELAFLRRAQDILSYDTLANQSSSDSPAKTPLQPQQPKYRTTLTQAQTSQRQITDITEAEARPDSGWFVWFWGHGLHTIFWQRLPGGNIIGAELDRVRLLADIIEILPEEDYSTENRLQGRIVLCNVADKSIYQWGEFEPPNNAAPLAQIPLRYPLGSWRLKYYLSPAYIQSFKGQTTYFTLAVGIVTAALALIVLAVYFYRENTRQIRLARKRVTFVNQVSHELKTPLTNIRMYAELMQNTLPDDQPRANNYLSVVVDETRRLTRLIANILSFSQSQKDQLKLRFVPAVVDDVINSVLANFKASFEKRHITAEFDANAPGLVQADPDAIAQILGNLLSNVEKYAASGGYVKITSRLLDSKTKITVADKGPGIPPNLSESIFQPFSRISNKLTDGVSGTGIGLTIARQLARLHGGDLVLLRTQIGASFEITLKTEPAKTGEEK